VISGKTYSTEVMERENQIKNDLQNARVYPEKGQRPSVETSLHNLIAFRFVVSYPQHQSEWADVWQRC